MGFECFKVFTVQGLGFECFRVRWFYGSGFRVRGWLTVGPCTYKWYTFGGKGTYTREVLRVQGEQKDRI